MRRGDFLKEMAGSLFQTAKSVYEPFLSEDLEKVEVVADRVLGISWKPLMKKEEIGSDLEMKFISGRPVIVARYGTNMEAIDGVCPVCSNIIVVTTLYSSGKCLNCQKTYNFNTRSGELQLKSYPLKLVDDTVFIGFMNKKQGGHDA
ncbi:Rieske (2Fe-2S) protein [Neobacillus jeddahensis]|uniref:hypothetical protein n=1 Tax=Neobacillus jeddahensis TaxID=1461580 RepID=UPI00058C6D86|nr:hypothetical protein [Neobacillus jeddahensis]